MIYDNEDAGDLSLSQAAGASEAKFEEYEEWLITAQPVCSCGDDRLFLCYGDDGLEVLCEGCGEEWDAATFRGENR